MKQRTKMVTEVFFYGSAALAGSEHDERERKILRSVLPEGATLRDVCTCIDRGGLQLALELEKDGKLLGVITDGDVRRALLGGATLETPAAPYINRRFITVPPGTSRAEIMDLMQSRRIRHVPIVDQEGLFLGLHLLSELISPMKLPNEAVILAGGRGTRLGALTQNLPKPMLKVAGRPILERLIHHLAGHGIRKIYLSVNYLASVIEEHFRDGQQYGCQIDYLREEEPMGTAGPLSLLQSRPSNPLLVLNGDLVTQFDVVSLLRHHAKHENEMTIGVRPYYHQVPFGCIEHQGQKVTQIVEKPTLFRLINAGIYVLEPSVLEHIPKEFYHITTLAEDRIAAGQQVGLFELTDDDWIDVGRKEELTRARMGGC